MNDALLEPISIENPSGVYLRYDFAYDRIREARREDDPLLAEHLGASFKEADFASVLRMTEEVLTKQSKDLQIAAWRTEALLAVNGFPGLAEGLDLMRELIERFWDTLYPEIEDGDLEMRAAPLEWVGRKLGDRAKRVPIVGSTFDYFAAVRRRRGPSPEEHDTFFEQFDAADGRTSRAAYLLRQREIADTIDTIDRFQRACDDRFGDEAPSFYPLRESLEEIRSAIDYRLSLKPPEPVEEFEAGSPEAEASGKSEPLLRAGLSPPEAILAAIRAMRAADRSDPAPYVLVRALRWTPLAEGQGGLTAPTSDTRTRLRVLHSGGDWDVLLQGSEAALENGAGGWLDLQRYTFKAGKELGLDRVAEAVRQATTVLVSRISGLSQSRLSDGTPAADPETLAWLNSLCPPEAVVDSGGASDGDLDALARRIPEQRCARDRFLRRLDLARLSLNSGQIAMAKALLADLSHEIEHRSLEDWEAPEVVAAVLELLLRATADDEELAKQHGELYARLCRIAPARALALQNRN